MKRITSPALVFLLAICALLGVGANQSARAGSDQFFDADGGHLSIKHSPVLGLNVAVAVRIDGRNAGRFAKGHIYERFLPPGRHLIELLPNGRAAEAGWMILDVRPGQTSAYTTTYNVDQLILQPRIR